ncbi:MAG: S49 family peptidase [Rhizobiaceae bacterium]|nr:MAG: S49 family peptidase [Rhizobiaceae bacterium]
MKYAHILLAVTEERWAIEPTKMQAILDFLADQASGVKYSAEEIEARLTQKAEREVSRQDGQIAILPLRGVIANRMSLMDDFSGGTSSEGFGKAFQAAMRDDGVKAIVLDVDSPGGAVSGTDELSSMIYQARGQKPIIAQVNARSASAAYWIASAADEMVVTPTGSVGSIGVIGLHEDVSGAMDKLGVKKTIISAGKYKAEGNPYEPLGDDTRARIQSKIDAAYDMFVRAVARNRGVNMSAVRDGFGEGDMVDAEPAVSMGMADRIGTMEDTLNRFGASQYGAPQNKRRAFAIEREKRALTL